ncbi:uroporphyrinogen-III synthase-like [Spodoptera litura]|uniref:Uroporphyrinogen-III synthase n=1 Tax=Spodoptera litura TaxID=69820 RepID=A0A9J7DQ58_SPOLT|nr:uroporphyrinogen-III synthase-like [Spodoptera litura]
MKKVVLFKKESEDYVKAFHECNYRTVFVEPLQFELTCKQELTEKLLQDYTGIVFTSPRAIEAVSKCWDPTRFVIWNTKKVYTIGDSSCHKIKLLLGLEAMGMSSGNAENLAKLIVQENPANSRFLFPCGNLRSEVLPTILQSSSISVDALTVYETTENKNLRTDLMELNEADCPCCMVFFSPSGCEYIHRQLQTFSNVLSELPHFAIGNSTAYKIENLGVEVAGIAATPKAESLVESIQKYFANA